MEKKKMPFDKCDKQFIENTFGIERVFTMPLLDKWLNEPAPMSNNEKEQLRQLLNNTILRMEDWNEEGLKMNFIGPFLSLVNFNSKDYAAFADEKLEAEIQDIVLMGKADWFVAKGKYRPEIPIFFLHEYKRAKKAVADPDGQLLAEMLVARQMNQSNEPLYGVVVMGRQWSFVVLNKNEYCISLVYEATIENELFDIFRILKTAKTYVEDKMKKLMMTKAN